MYSIARLEELILTSENTLARYNEELTSNPNSIFTKGIVKNTSERLSELRANLTFEKRLRELEVIDLRLIGKVAQLGRLPLELLGSFSKLLSDTLHEAGRQYQYGNKAGLKYMDEIKQSINLKFERLVPGSTRIIITGNSNPDLFGNSIIETALSNTFDVLNITDTSDLIHSSEKVGGSSIKKLHDLLCISLKNDLEFELEWTAPNDKKFKWKGNSDKMLALSNTLSAIDIDEPRNIEMSGTLISQSIKGQIEIKGEDKKTIKIAFSNDMLEKVKSLKIGDYCSSTISHHVLTNKITGEQKNAYTLVDIRY